MDERKRTLMIVERKVMTERKRDGSDEKQLNEERKKTGKGVRK